MQPVRLFCTLPQRVAHNSCVRLTTKTAKSIYDVDHAERVQVTIIIKLLADVRPFFYGNVPERRPQKLQARGGAVLDRQMVVAGAGQCRQDGFHAG